MKKNNVVTRHHDMGFICDYICPPRTAIKSYIKGYLVSGVQGCPDIERLIANAVFSFKRAIHR